MRILLLTRMRMDAFGGVEYHRLYTPFNRMSLDYDDIEVFHFPTLRMGNGVVTIDGKEYQVPMKGNLPDKKWLEQFDVCVFNRNISEFNQPHEEFNRLWEAGVKIVVDVDDYWEVHKGHVLYKYQEANNLHLCQAHQIQMADMVWCTHKKLSQAITNELGRKRNIVTIPNAIDPQERQYDLTANKHEYNNVFYQGSVTHYGDLKLVAPAINKVGAKMSIGGYVESDPEWQKIGKLFNDFTPIEAKPVFRYAEMYRDQGICIIPLADNHFNRGKSELKMIEAGYFKKAVIVSNVYPYTRLAVHGKNSLLVDNNWEKPLQDLLNSTTLQDELRGKLHEDVLERYLIGKANEKRVQALRTLC